MKCSGGCVHNVCVSAVFLLYTHAQGVKHLVSSVFCHCLSSSAQEDFVSWVKVCCCQIQWGMIYIMWVSELPESLFEVH